MKPRLAPPRLSHQSHLFCAAAALCGLLAVPVAAQNVTWVQRSGAAPVARIGAAMAHHAARQETVLFGGSGIGGIRNDTWVHVGTTWTQRFPTGPIPSVRVSHSMAYDPVNQVVVLFGGQDLNGMSVDTTWEWNGTQWTNRTPPATAPQPTPRCTCAMTFDEGLGQVLLFGGADSFGPTYNPFDETWAWSGATGSWTLLLPATRPPADAGDSMAYDCARQRTVLVQRTTGTSPPYVDTWEFDSTANTWLQRTPATRPGARFQFQVAYDRTRQRVVLFGGGPFSAPQTALADTWEWDGIDWTLQAPLVAPPSRQNHALTWDATRERVVVFGGQDPAPPSPRFNDTWDYVSLSPATFTNTGIGCGAGGPLTLAAAPCSLPWLGDPFTVDVGNVPSGSLLFLLVGLAQTSLPTPWPGCTQQVTMDAVAFLPAPSWTMTLPAAPAFSGMSIFLQAAAVESSGALSASDVGHAGLGLR